MTAWYIDGWSMHAGPGVVHGAAGLLSAMIFIGAARMAASEVEWLAAMATVSRTATVSALVSARTAVSEATRAIALDAARVVTSGAARKAAL
jgi:hypothetical protein